MEQITKTVFFDFDGVIADTEPLYDKYWDEASHRYNVGIDNFAAVIKGTTLPNIIKKYFNDRSEDFKRKVVEESRAFEENMPFPLIPGARKFLELLKAHNVKIGLVTSSEDGKLSRALKILNFENMFDTVVSANRIKYGKPDPMCYLLAAEDLKVAPENCLVFEDSFAGIESANRAKMHVVGLSTTNSADSLIDKVEEVIPNFENITWEHFIKW